MPDDHQTRRWRAATIGALLALAALAGCGGHGMKLGAAESLANAVHELDAYAQAAAGRTSQSDAAACAAAAPVVSARYAAIHAVDLTDYRSSFLSEGN
jgi:hypothetical protein